MLTLYWSQLGICGNLSSALQAPAQHGPLRNACTPQHSALCPCSGIFVPGVAPLFHAREQNTLKVLYGLSCMHRSRAHHIAGETTQQANERPILELHAATK